MAQLRQAKWNEFTQLAQSIEAQLELAEQCDRVEDELNEVRLPWIDQLEQEMRTKLQTLHFSPSHCTFDQSFLVCGTKQLHRVEYENKFGSFQLLKYSQYLAVQLKSTESTGDEMNKRLFINEQDN